MSIVFSNDFLQHNQSGTGSANPATSEQRRDRELFGYTTRETGLRVPLKAIFEQ